MNVRRELASITHHRVDLSPAYRTDSKGRSSGHGKAVMHFRSEEIGTSSEPLFAAARYLLNKCLAEPEEIVAIYRDGLLSMSAKVGCAAGLTVIETGGSSEGTRSVGPRIGKFRPFNDAKGGGPDLANAGEEISERWPA